MLFPAKPLSSLTPDLEARDEFLTQAVRVLLAALKEFNLPAVASQSENYEKALDLFSKALAEEKSITSLERSLLGCRHALSSQSHLMKSCLKQKEAELRKVVNALTRHLSVLAEESFESARDLDGCVQLLEQAEREPEADIFRRQVNQQVSSLKTGLSKHQRRRESTIAQICEQVALLNKGIASPESSAALDPLTGAGNKKGLERALKERVQKASAQGGRFAVLLWDVDDLKMVNDRHGHLVGDGVLKNLVQICQRMIRGGDYVGRYGGDEFAVVLEDVEANLAERRAKEIAKAVESAELKFSSGRGEVSLKVTISIGISDFRAGDTPEALLERADWALYRARREGRNLCRLYRAPGA